MSKKIQIITLITALTVGLSLATAADARERSRNQYNAHNTEVLIIGQNGVFYKSEADRQRVAYRPGRGHYVNDHKFKKRAKYLKKKRRINRLRRLNSYHKFDRPVIIITRPLHR